MQVPVRVGEAEGERAAVVRVRDVAVAHEVHRADAPVTDKCLPEVLRLALRQEGAAGQALQNLNVAFGLDETTGLS